MITEFSDWWNKITNKSYVPMIYRALNSNDLNNLNEWADTCKKNNWDGTCGIPFMSTILSFIDGSYTGKILQLGHHVGYSTLLISMYLRNMKLKNNFISTDICKNVTNITQNFVNKFKLSDYVKLYSKSSLDNDFISIAKDFKPNIIIIDSSHQFEQTYRELQIYYELLNKGGFIFLHDSSEYAKQWDSTSNGGVKDAINIYKDKNSSIKLLNINDFVGNFDNKMYGESLSYLDRCGICIIAKGEC